jgi:hypothetical protein
LDLYLLKRLGDDICKGGTARVGRREEDGPALEAMYRFVVWLIPTLDKLPRSQKFLFGARIKKRAPLNCRPL